MKKERFKLLSAVHLFLLRGDQVLLLRRFNTSYEDGNYSVIAGHLDGNEPVKAAMVREAREEAGIEIDPLDVQVIGVMHRRSDDERIDWFLSAEHWRGEVVNCEPHRCDQLAWFALDALPENVIPYVRRGLENYRRGRCFDSFGWPASIAAPLGVRPLGATDHEWAVRFLIERWGSERTVVHGAMFWPGELPGFVAEQGGERVGLLTYHVDGSSCEIVTVDSARPGQGIGTALVAAVETAARQAGCRRLWLVTTNDNVEALRFYQRRGLSLVAVRPGAVTAARRLKPEIPLTGLHDIPLRDEIELEMVL